jgi:class 3 adenylate cyclase
MGAFEDAFNARYREDKALSESVALAMQKKAADLDHPAFIDLPWGQTLSGEAAVMFVDIRGYTRLAMAYADRPHETAKILDAVVGGAVEVLPKYNAHINDFTGDGVMAIFGGGPGDLDRAHDESIWAAADLMTEMSATLRQELLDVEIADPVRIAIGLVSGPVLWKRVGTPLSHRVMAVGEVAPLAAKYVTGEETAPWQTMIGGRVIDAVPERFRESAPDYVHQYKNERMPRKRWLLKTSELWNAAGSAEGVVRLRSTAALPLVEPTHVDKPRVRRGDGHRGERTIG